MFFLCFRTKKLIEENELHLEEIQKILEVSVTITCWRLLCTALAPRGQNAINCPPWRETGCQKACILQEGGPYCWWNRELLIKACSHSAQTFCFIYADAVFRLCVGITVCTGFLSLKILWSLIRKVQWKFYWSCSYLLKMKTVWLLKTCVYTSFKMCMYVSIIWKWLVFQNDKRYLTLECVPDDRRKILMMHIEELDRKGPPPPPTASEPSRRNAK